MTSDFFTFAAVGLAAQLIDGAIGMAFKVLASSLLLGMGVPPAVASTCVHAAGTFTSLASAISHWTLGNLDRPLVLRLALPGLVGGIAGAMVLASVPAETIRPWVSLYLVAMAGFILWTVVRPALRPTPAPGRQAGTALAGGFLDAVGGGGWGPIVTSSLVGGGIEPRIAIGSSNIAELAVTATIAGTLVLTVGAAHWPIVAGLVAGGVVAAPFAALAARYAPERALKVAVGLVVLGLGCRALI